MRVRIRVISLVLCLLLTVILSACESKGNPNVEQSSQGSNFAPSQTVELSTDSRILIAYFSWANNTVSTDNVDAVASASVTVPGNTAVIAEMIHKQTGGVLYPITVTDFYPSDYDACLRRATDEKAQKVRPTLADRIENFEDYDVVFLGFPNWCYTAPMPVFSFIESYDFSDKTVIPFCSHGTGGLASSVKDITAALPSSASVKEALGIYREDTGNAEEQIRAWLDSFDL